jgi:hypothetical protein
MIFHITHIHSPELCPSDNPEKVEKTVSIVASDSHAKAAGVKVLGRYIAPAEHILYFIIEVDNYEAVTEYLRPMMKMGTPRITPVSVLGEAIKPFLK